MWSGFPTSRPSSTAETEPAPLSRLLLARDTPPRIGGPYRGLDVDPFVGTERAIMTSRTTVWLMASAVALSTAAPVFAQSADAAYQRRMETYGDQRAAYDQRS